MCVCKDKQTFEIVARKYIVVVPSLGPSLVNKRLVTLSVLLL